MGSNASGVTWRSTTRLADAPHAGGQRVLFRFGWVFLILDNLRVHHARPVKAWLAEHADAIEVFYLPSYSPELNPDEMANADIKHAATKLAPARTKLQLVKATARHLRSVQRQPERIRKYFEHGPVRYAA